MHQILFTLLFAISSQLSTAQDLVGIRHFQRSSNAFQFVFPTDTFSSKGLTIGVPDSVYSFGDIRIKKAEFVDFTLKNYLLHFESDSIQSVQFILTGKKNHANLTAFMGTHTLNFSSLEIPAKALTSFTIELKNEHHFTYTTHKKGRKYYIVLSSNTAETSSAAKQPKP